MYLRTTQRKNKDGSTTTYYQLAHNERDPVTRKSIARVIHNFGRADELDRDTLVRLCHSIARVCGLTVSDSFTESPESSEAGGKCRGLPKGIEIVNTVEFGPMLVIQKLWERIGLGKLIRDMMKENKLKVRYDLAALAMTANRLCEPQSKLGVWDRWLANIYLPESEDLKLQQMYEAMDLMYYHMAEIEKNVFFTTADLLNLDVDVIFYDTTTARFHIDEADEEEDEEEGIEGGLRQYGRPKEGGFAPQVVVALAVTREGLPVKSWVFPGNKADIATVMKVKEDLKGWKIGRALFVADSGMNSDENRVELARGCGKYLLASRMGSVKEIKENVLTRRGRYQVISENLQVKEAAVGDGVRKVRYILCYNPKEAERQQKHRTKVLAQIERIFRRHKDKNALAQWAIELKASKRYGKYLKIRSDNTIEIDHVAIKEAERYDGKWVVQTNDDTLTAEDAASGYKALLVIERCFRSLKNTQVKMTPMFHWLPRRIETHVKICVLALLIERMAELSCGKSWSRIRGSLRRLGVSKFRTENFYFFQRNEPPFEVNSILKSLKISLPNKVLRVEPHS